METNNLEIINKRNDEEFAAVKEIMSAAHSVAKAATKAKPLEDALQSDDLDFSVSVLIKYIQKYEKLINFLEPFTGKRVIYQEGYYVDKPFLVKSDLKFLRTIVYVDEAKNYGLEKVIEKSLKKIAEKYPNQPQEVTE